MNEPTKTRVYIVSVAGQEPRLVRASHPLNAVRHVAQRLLSVKLAGQDELIELVGSGVKCEQAGEEQPGGNGADPRQGEFLGLGS